MKPGSVVFVTGAANGIGAATAELFVSEGHRVAACDVDEAGLTELVQRIGDAICPLRLDVRDEAQWNEALDAAERRLGPVDVLVNNAGLVHIGFTSQLSSEQIRHMVEVNFLGMVTGCRMVLPRMIDAGGGRIVNVGSLAGFAPLKGQGVYSATKHAVRAFHHALAIEHADDPITFSLVCPGPVDTEMLRRQVGHDAGAMSFSEDAVTPGEVAQGIYKAARQGVSELLLPAFRGELLRIAGTYPGVVRAITKRAESAGKRAMAKRSPTAGDGGDRRIFRG